MTGLLITLIIGAIAGFLAGKIVKGHGFGLLGNIVVGLLGAALFGVLFGRLHLLGTGLLNEIAGGTLGAVLLLFAIRFLKKAA